MSAPAEKDPLSALIEEKGILLADGATGTTLFEMGLVSGEAPELWNEQLPSNIAKLHRGFVEAGSDIILTNSFGATHCRLKLHNAQDRVHRLNRIAAEIAREEADRSGRRMIVAGSVGPTGELLFPLGALTYEQAVEAFVEQMEGLKDGGADVMWIETMSSAEEIRAAAEAAIAVGMPYVFTASFDTAGRTMMGLLPSDIHGVTLGLQRAPLAVGANCGVGASDLLASVLDMTKADSAAVVVAKANCGIPVVRGDKVEYTGTPELMSRYACLAADAGATIIGGCCGTTCEHVTAMRRALDERVPGNRPALEEVTASIGPLVNKAATSDADMPRRERKGRRSA
jgi:5-methyltetrahydrofolate--homocysteine methyltransferase